jgi:uncharacterized protein (TIGR02680 family)
MDNTTTVNKWQLHRAGLFNFWYYDDEEFYFADGRLLLRGSNGSGKSVTMQSLITVLLDGVKSPDRLDSFGSRSRRMEDYLLGEKEIVQRDERTGYLYLEYKRQQTEQYLTTGIGLQARRNSHLDFWGFVLTDNRRIKHDLLLYKAEINPENGSEQRIPLTRIELERVIGSGGQVVRSQKDYMELVNRHIFGFETAEQYQELMKLLIQLRSPKLSKDFKPSVIYEILNESLPSLSDEELRPLSDTIESMERTKLQIGQLERDRQALGRLGRQYDFYNRYVLAEKADLAQKARQRRNRLERETQELIDRLAADRQTLTDVVRRQGELEREFRVLQREKGELEQHDVFRAEQQKQERERELSENEAVRRDKDQQFTVKKRREREEREAAGRYEQQADQAETQITALGQEMAEIAVAVGFIDHQMLAEAFRNAVSSFSFPVWRQNAQRHQAKLEAVLEILRRLTQMRQQRERAEQELGEERRSLEEYRAEHRRLEQRFSEGRDQLLADFYQWQQQYGAILPLEQDELRLGAQALQGLYEGHTWSEVLGPLEAAYGRRITAINQELGLVNAKIKQGEAREAELTRELRQWQTKVDPEPERLPDNQATRELLIKQQIPFLPLYAAVEFRPEVSPEQRERLEAVLTEMGLLDALIVPKSKLGAIPTAATYGVVLHPNPQLMTETLADYLYPTPPEQGTVTFAEIDAVLRTIVVDPSGTWTEELSEPVGTPVVAVAPGAYRLGMVSGRAPRRSAAVYIGRQARQEYRRQQIVLLEQQLQALALEQEALYTACREWRRQLEAVRQARQDFLTETEIRELFNDKQARQGDIERQVLRVEAFDKRLRTVIDQLQALREQLQAVGEGLPLTASEAAYQEALQLMRDYQLKLHELELGWRDYENNRHNARQCRERLAEIEADVDSLRGEILMLDGQIEGLGLELEQINRRLQELGVTELQEQVRRIARRLEELPQETKLATETGTKLETVIDANEIHLAGLRAKYAFYEQLDRAWQRVLEEELRLRLVYPESDIVDNTVLGQLKEKVFRQEKLDRTTVTERLANSFYVENNILMEYRMQLEPLTPSWGELPVIPAGGDPDDSLAGELEKLREKAPRQIVTLDYEGRRQNPYQMQATLEQQIARQHAILSEQDKELYEEVIMNSIGRIISRRIAAAQQWVDDMNQLMRQRDNSSGLRFKLEWKPRLAETETEMDVPELVRLLRTDPVIIKEADLQKMMQHFQTRIERAKRSSEGAAGNLENAVTFQQAVREVLDYRLWFQFKLFFERTDTVAWRELTDKMFFKFSGGEKAMAMYIPLFSAAYSRYQEARPDAPYIITLDEAFAGVDENNIRDTFALVEQLGFNYIMNSQALWGDYDVVPQLTICELLRPKNAAFVTVVRYRWNGRVRILQTGEETETLVAAAGPTG